MKKIFQILFDSTWFAFVFFMIQFAFVLLGSAIWKDMMSNPTALSFNMFGSSVTTIILFWMMKLWKEKKGKISKIPHLLYPLVGCLAFLSLAPSVALNEAMGVEMNEQTERIIMSIIESPWGFVIVAVLVPLAEEIVFRGTLLRRLLIRFRNPWIPILISAIVFGCVHGNMAQFIHATLLGILLGWLYYNTRSVLPGLALHFVNNFIAFIGVKLFPETQNQSLIEIYEGNMTQLVSDITMCTILLVTAIYIIQTRLFSHSKSLEAYKEHL